MLDVQMILKEHLESKNYLLKITSQTKIKILIY